MHSRSYCTHYSHLLGRVWSVVSYRGVYSDASILKAIRHQFSAFAEVPVLFSRISILAQNSDDGELEVEVIDEQSDSPPGDELSRAVAYDDLEEHGAEAPVARVSSEVPMQFYPDVVNELQQRRPGLRIAMPVASLSGLSFDPSLGSLPPISGPFLNTGRSIAEVNRVQHEDLWSRHRGGSINIQTSNPGTSRSGMTSLGPSVGTISIDQPSSNIRQSRSGTAMFENFQEDEDISMSSPDGRSQEASSMSLSAFSSSLFSFERSKGDATASAEGKQIDRIIFK